MSAYAFALGIGTLLLHLRFFFTLVQISVPFYTTRVPRRCIMLTMQSPMFRVAPTTRADYFSVRRVNARSANRPTRFTSVVRASAADSGAPACRLLFFTDTRP